MCAIQYASHEVSVLPLFYTLALAIQGFLFLPNSPQELVSASAHSNRSCSVRRHTVKGRTRHCQPPTKTGNRGFV